MGKWEMVKWEQVLQIKNGKNQKAVQSSSGTYPIYGSGGIMGYANDYICPEKTTIIGRKGSINSPIYVEQKFWNVDTAFGLVANPNLDSKFLYYFCVQYNFQRHNKAVTIPSLTKSDLLQISMSLPPLDEQKRIAKNLDLASEIVKGHKAQLAELDKLVQSVFYEMFGDPVTNEKGWAVVKLGKTIELLTDFSANGAYKYLDSNVKMYDDSNYALMVRTTDLEKNDFTNDVKYIDENAYKILAKSKVLGNEIIMCKIGSAGKIYLMPKLNMPVSLGRNAFLIRLKQNVNVVFIYNLLSTNYGKAEIMQYVRGAVTKTITKDSVRDIRLIIPPLPLQARFASIVTEIEAQKAQVQQALTQAENLFNSLMQEYFE